MKERIEIPVIFEIEHDGTPDVRALAIEAARREVHLDMWSSEGFGAKTIKGKKK